MCLWQENLHAATGAMQPWKRSTAQPSFGPVKPASPHVLHARFDKGTIHCTPTTAALARTQLRVPEARLSVHRLDEVFQLEGRTLRFVDANHCPGAAMVVVEPGPGSGGGGPRRGVLHTGDCRLHAGMQQHPALCALRGAADLVLDTTYCDPQYTFPQQREVRRWRLR